MDLCRHVVDAVRDIVVFPEGEQVRGLGQIEELVRLNVAGGENVQHPLAHDLRLGPSASGSERNELTVQIALFHPVLVHQGERPHARTGERLGAPAAHAAETEHGDVAAVQRVHAVRAEHHFGA